MTAKRKKAQNDIITFIKKISGTDFHTKLYQDAFDRMDDEQFTEFIIELKNKEHNLSIVESESKIDVERNLKLAKELDFSFTSHITFANPDDGSEFTPEVKFLVMLQPFKRTVQSHAKKAAIPTNNNTFDVMSGQVTGDSGKSKLTYSELQLCNSMGMHKSLIELMKTKGGDLGSLKAMEAMLNRYGKADLDSLEPYSTGVQSLHTLKAYLLAMMLENNP